MSSTIIAEPRTKASPPTTGPSTPSPPTAPIVTPAVPQGFIKEHALPMFFGIAFAISFAGILLVIGLGGVEGGVAMTDARFGLMMLAWLAGPSIASIVMTGVASSRPGYRDLLRRLSTWRVGVGWYALALLLAPLVSVGLSYAMSVFSPEFLPSIVTTADPTGILVIGLIAGLLGGGFLEELGWTGFAV
ncbi:MAG TPA: hypothetical protein VKB76_13050, partial [Ktedonobacterales bacterium]|nr:hypothetical protein [Ktedonobacterales bacterium]